MTERVINEPLRRKDRNNALERAMELAMEVAADPEITLLDQLKIEAQVLIPVLEALRKEIGQERADSIVITALRDWRRTMILRAGELVPGDPKGKWDFFRESMQQNVESAIDVDVLRDDDEALEADIVGCRYADLFHSVDEPGLGAALACECDDHMAEVVGPKMEYRRTQTIMQGASCCDFRYRMHFAE